MRHLSQPCRPSLRWVELYVAPTGTSTIVTVHNRHRLGKLLLSAADTVSSRPALRSHSSILPRHRCRRIRPAHTTSYPPQSSQLYVCSLDLCIPRPPSLPHSEVSAAVDGLRNLVFTERYSIEARHALGAVTCTALHPFPLAKLYESLAAPHLHTACTEKFPSSLRVMCSLMIVLHPWLLPVSVATGGRYPSSFSNKSGSVLLLRKLLDLAFWFNCSISCCGTCVA